MVAQGTSSKVIFIEIHEMQNEGEQKFKAHKQCDHVLDEKVAKLF